MQYESQLAALTLVWLVTLFVFGLVWARKDVWKKRARQMSEENIDIMAVVNTMKPTQETAEMLHHIATCPDHELRVEELQLPSADE